MSLLTMLVLLGPGHQSPVPVGKPHGHSMLEMPELEQMSPTVMTLLWGEPREIPGLGEGWMFQLKPEHNPAAYAAALVVLPKGRRLSVRMWGASMSGANNAQRAMLRKAAWEIRSGR
jgi:hypothetical protein